MPARFTLWHSANTRSLRILVTLKELGLTRGTHYALKMLSFPPREHHPEFVSSTNILGTVPWFEHKEAWDAQPRASMSESCAVPLYLTALHPKSDHEPVSSTHDNIAVHWRQACLRPPVCTEGLHCSQHMHAVQASRPQQVDGELHEAVEV